MKKTLLGLCVVLSLVSVARAANRYWTGVGSDANWTTTGNWDVYPVHTDVCYLDHVGNYDPAISSAVQCFSPRLGNSYSDSVTLTINNGGFLDTTQSGTNNWTFVGYADDTNGRLAISGGGSLKTKDLDVGCYGHGELTMADGATLTVTQRIYLGELSNHGGGVVTMTGGTVDMTTNASFAEYIAVGNAASGSSAYFDMSGGTINMNSTGGDSYITIGQATSSTGQFDLSGGTVNCPMVYVAYNGTGTLNLSGTGVLTARKNIMIGKANSHGDATINMTGGTINMNTNTDPSYSEYLGLGCAISSSNVLFDMSAGTINMDPPGDSNPSCIAVGYAEGSTATFEMSGGTINGGKLAVARDGRGTLRIEGSAGAIDVISLFVGGYEFGANKYGGHGTLEYVINSGGVTPIEADSVTLQVAATGSVSDLVVSLAAAPPAGSILLVDNQGTSPVVDIFDSLNGGSAAEGAPVVLSYGGVDYHYTLTYQGVAGLDGLANDIMLVPEPSTLAMLALALGLLSASRRRRHSR